MWKVLTWIHNLYSSSSNFLQSFFLSVSDQATNNTKPAPVGQPFQPIVSKCDFPLQLFSNLDWKSWLHYNAEKDAALCSTCINATRMNIIASKNADKAFILNGFANW